MIALWSASAAVSNLLTAIDVAYDEEEKRGFVKKRLLSLGLTLAAIVFMVIMLGIVAVLPPLLKATFGTGTLRWVFQILGWLVLVLLVAVVLAILYRIAPHHNAPRMLWVSVGAAVATAIWLIRLDRVLDLFIHRRQLCQDLRRVRRNRRAAPLALAEHVRDLVRRGDRRRGRGRATDDRRLRSWR